VNEALTFLVRDEDEQKVASVGVVEAHSQMSMAEHVVRGSRGDREAEGKGEGGMEEVS
jgi:hypothetical protein